MPSIMTEKCRPRKFHRKRDQYIPQTDRDHNEPKICNDNLSHHASASVHQEHVHQSREPVLSLPESL